jgi:hypothetical protein
MTFQARITPQTLNYQRNPVPIPNTQCPKPHCRRNPLILLGQSILAAAAFQAALAPLQPTRTHPPNRPHLILGSRRAPKKPRMPPRLRVQRLEPPSEQSFPRLPSQKAPLIRTRLRPQRQSCARPRAIGLPACRSHPTCAKSRNKSTQPPRINQPKGRRHPACKWHPTCPTK